MQEKEKLVGGRGKKRKDREVFRRIYGLREARNTEGKKRMMSRD